MSSLRKKSILLNHSRGKKETKHRSCIKRIQKRKLLSSFKKKENEIKSVIDECRSCIKFLLDEGRNPTKCEHELLLRKTELLEKNVSTFMQNFLDNKKHLSEKESFVIRHSLIESLRSLTWDYGDIKYNKINLSLPVLDNLLTASKTKK